MKLDFSDDSLYVKWIQEFTKAYYDPNIRNIFIKGWAWAGKSVAVAQLLIQNMDIYKILCVRKISESIKDSIHAEFIDCITKRWLDEYWWSYIDRPPEVRFNGKTATIYKGIQHAKDREKLKSVQGIDQAWIEEATELSKDDYDQIQLRVRSWNNNKTICTFNPIDTDSRLKKEVEDKREYWKHNSVWIEKWPFDNNFLSDSYLDSLNKMKVTNPAYYKIYVENQRWQWLKGLIYTDYSVFDYDIYPDVIGLDFGYNDPTAFVYLRVDDKEDIKDLYVQEKLYRTHMTGNDIVDWLNNNNVPKEILIVADNARPEIIQQIRGAWYMIIPVEKGKNSITDWISKIKEYRLHVRGKNLVKEISTYCWKLDKNWEPLDTPADWNDHLCDAMRYWVKEKRMKKWARGLVVDI